jgi:hypothetical protein
MLSTTFSPDDTKEDREEERKGSEGKKAQQM